MFSKMKTIWRMTILALVFCCIVPPSNSISDGTKVYIQFETIDVVVPLQNGFHVILTQAFADKYLMSRLQTHLTMLISATEVTDNPNATSVQRLDYGENLSRANTIKLGDLRPNTWYFLCVEFEIASREEKTSATDCRLVRTLDTRGGSAHGPINKIAPLGKGHDFLEFRVESDTDFPSRVTAFLDKGSRPAQVFMIDEASEIEIYFGELNPGTGYGRFCVLFEPLVEAYTMLGRSIQVKSLKCLPRNVETEDN